MSNTPTMGERLDAISARMDAAYAERREVMNDPRKYAEADEKIEAVYRDLRALNAEMKGEHVISDTEECWCEPVHVKVDGGEPEYDPAEDNYGRTPSSLPDGYLDALAREPRGFA